MPRVHSLEAARKPPKPTEFRRLAIRGRRRAPTLFGSERLQKLILETAQNGKASVGTPRAFFSAGVRAGILLEHRLSPGAATGSVTLNPAYPAIVELLSVLADIGGQPLRSPTGTGSRLVHPTLPLGHAAATPFRVILVFVQAGQPLDEETIRRRLPDRWPSDVSNSISQLVEGGVLDAGRSRTFALSSKVPDSFKALVLRLADEIDDPRLRPSDAAGTRTSAFQHAADAAPRLFGTDARICCRLLP